MGSRFSATRGAARHGLGLLLLGALVCGGAGAQMETPYAIRVETPEVVVPAVVLDRSRRLATATSYEELDEEITDLSIRDFHVFEDGVAQTIDTITMELPHIRDVQDNFSHHIEYSFTPRGFWASADLSPVFGANETLSPLATYLVAYTPPASSRGSCHQIKVRVTRRHATVYARDEYCNVNHPLSDPIGGTKIGKQMLNYAESGNKGTFPVFVQAGSYVNDLSANRVEIAVEFPPGAVRRKWAGVNLYATVAVLGVVRDNNGTVVARFSDMTSTLPWNFYRGPLPPDRTFLKTWENAAIPSRYETQIELPPGMYKIQVVITDGENFGWEEVPVTVNPINQNDSLLGDILLCKRFHNVLEGAQASARAPKYVPLASDGAEFTPAGDMRFARSQKLVGYFEIRAPSTGRLENTNFRIRVKDVRTGDLKIDTDWHKVPAQTRLNHRTIPIAAELAIDGLAPGAYLLEVEAQGSAEQQPTDRRTSSFTIE
jgi:hypothetical protein